MTSAAVIIGVLIFAVAVGGLADRLTRQKAQMAQARGEAEDLARLAADILTASGRVAPAIGPIRRTFGLDGAALLRREDTGWRTEAAAGQTRLEHPDQASLTVELAHGQVLALAGTGLTGRHAALLQVFVSQLRLARERAQLSALLQACEDARQRASQ